MEGPHRVFLSGILLGAACGFLGGHLLFRGPLNAGPEIRRTASPVPARFATPAGELRDIDEQSPNTTVTNALAVAELPSLLMTPPATNTGRSLSRVAQLPQDFDDDPFADFLPREQIAAGTGTAPKGAAVQPPVQLEILSARPLSEIVESNPSPEESPRAAEMPDDELSKLIRERMGELPPEEQEVWYESLQELTLPHAAGVLEMWQNSGRARPMPHRLFPGIDLGSPPSAVRGEDLFNPLPATVRPPAVHSHPVEQLRSAASMQATRQMHRENLCYAHVAGYRSRIPGVELTTAGEQLSSRISFRQGAAEKTGRPLDCRIVGLGFFRVTDGEQEFFTRCGQFNLDAERRLVLDTSSQCYRLVPEFQFPADTAAIHIQETGHIVIVTTEGSQHEVGPLELWNFANLAGLEVENPLLFRSSERSGPPVRVKLPGEAFIESGVLELSNVDIAYEQQRLQQLESARH